jgi:hypothetical protein
MSPDYKQAISRKNHIEISGKIARIAVERDAYISHRGIAAVLYSLWQ